MGHTEGAGGLIISKSDNENAVKALKDAGGKLLGVRVILENPPKGAKPVHRQDKRGWKDNQRICQGNERSSFRQRQKSNSKERTI